MTPIVDAARAHFVTSTTAARRMTAQGSGVIVMLSSSAARESRHQMGGFNLACASIEALTRSLAGEVGRQGVRVVCLRPNFTGPTPPPLRGRRHRRFRRVDHAGAMTGAVVNLTCGAIFD
jgi:3-oxoacyl-[acyl-carrier protein] reductase